MPSRSIAVGRSRQSASTRLGRPVCEALEQRRLLASSVVAGDEHDLLIASYAEAHLVSLDPENECLWASGANGPAPWSDDSMFAQSKKLKKNTPRLARGPTAQELPSGVGYIYHTISPKCPTGHISIWVRDESGTHVYSFGPEERNGGPGWGVYNYDDYRQYIGPNDYVVHVPPARPERVREHIHDEIPTNQSWDLHENNCSNNAMDALDDGAEQQFGPGDSPALFHQTLMRQAFPVLWGPETGKATSSLPHEFSAWDGVSLNEDADLYYLYSCVD